MAQTMTAPPRWLNSLSRFRRWREYRSFLRSRSLSTWLTSPCEQQVNEQINDGPSNHRYGIHKCEIVPSFQLYERWSRLASILPGRIDTFLDIGCCYGYYVLQAAQWPGCRLAVGVDVHEPFVSAAREAGALLRFASVAFHTATVDEIASDPRRYGGPFQVVFLLGTYHYIFWGSARSRYALRSHEEILACLSKLTAGCIVFSARLELPHLPTGVRKRACSSPEAERYTTASFLQAAESFFDVEHGGFLGGYPLFVLHKQNAGSEGPDSSSRAERCVLSFSSDGRLNV